MALLWYAGIPAIFFILISAFVDSTLIDIHSVYY